MTLPVPKAGLVLSYAYPWHREHLAGHDEGLKDRPAVVVLAVGAGSFLEVTVLPITHRPPDNPDWAIEIPLPIKRHLGLDDARSWIVVAEGNDFLWPGYDLRKISSTGRYDYGFVPPRFFKQVLQAFDALRQTGAARLTPRE